VSSLISSFVYDEISSLAKFAESRQDRSTTFFTGRRDAFRRQPESVAMAKDIHQHTARAKTKSSVADNTVLYD
jgi:hypothetical protein